MDYVKSYNQNIKSGKIKTYKKRCLCNSEDSKIVVKKDRYGLWHHVTICKKCGLIQSNPQLTDEEYSKFYSSDLYRKLYSGNNFIIDSEKNYLPSNQIFKMLNPIMKKNGFNKVIEFGCGGGWNLLPFQKNNYDVIGYDYSEGLIQLGKTKYGLNLKQGSFNDLKVGEKYDVLILNHVIEHFTDIENNLTQLRRIIKKNGIIYVGIPNIDLISRGQFQNAHTYYFTPRTFCYYMQKFGFEVINFGPDESIHMHGIFKLSKYNKTDKNLNLENEYNFMRKKIFFSLMKIKVINLLDLLKILNPIKKILHKFY